MTWWGPYIGKPYADFNCWQLVRAAYRDVLGIDPPHHSDISASDFRAVARGIDAEAALWAEADGSRPLDVVLMRKHRLPIHVGVITRPGWMLHTEKETDAVHVPIDRFSVRGRIVGFRRLPG